MTTEDIIRLAREAHRRVVTDDYPGHTGQLDAWTLALLERFAALVAAAEREACACDVEQYGGAWDATTSNFARLIRARSKE
jgi:hypothetical protein